KLPSIPLAHYFRNPELMNWEIIWKLVFIMVVSLFALMTVLTTIFGARDVRTLFRRLKEDDANSE
ncbi:MAG: hypothetical protein AAF585_10830, partial [Verrucomicrobiota bacterium]